MDVEFASLMLEKQNHPLLRKGAAGSWETASAISNALQNCLLLNYFNLVSKAADDNHIQCRKQSCLVHVYNSLGYAAQLTPLDLFASLCLALNTSITAPTWNYLRNMQMCHYSVFSATSGASIRPKRRRRHACRYTQLEVAETEQVRTRCHSQQRCLTICSGWPFALAFL